LLNITEKAGEFEWSRFDRVKKEMDNFLRPIVEEVKNNK
jgi:hypothetical protein